MREGLLEFCKCKIFLSLGNFFCSGIPHARGSQRERAAYQDHDASASSRFFNLFPQGRLFQIQTSCLASRARETQTLRAIPRCQHSLSFQAAFVNGRGENPNDFSGSADLFATRHATHEKLCANVHVFSL
jgi:hypothetical protein